MDSASRESETAMRNARGSNCCAHAEHGKSGFPVPAECGRSQTSPRMETNLVWRRVLQSKQWYILGLLWVFLFGINRCSVLCIYYYYYYYYYRRYSGVSRLFRRRLCTCSHYGVVSLLHFTWSYLTHRLVFDRRQTSTYKWVSIIITSI